jgi:hypothetical protein
MGMRRMMTVLGIAWLVGAGAMGCGSSAGPGQADRVVPPAKHGLQTRLAQAHRRAEQLKRALEKERRAARRPIPQP